MHLYPILFSNVKISRATIICAWGDRGAMARAPDGNIVQSPAFPPRKIIDTLGAGDCFNAAVLYYLNKQKLFFEEQRTKESTDESVDQKAVIQQNYNIESSERSQTDFIDRGVLQTAVTFACRVAGAKIGLRYYEGLDEIYKNFL